MKCISLALGLTFARALLEDDIHIGFGEEAKWICGGIQICVNDFHNTEGSFGVLKFKGTGSHGFNALEEGSDGVGNVPKN